MGDTPVEVALSLRAQHAEGPLWDAATARLWWVDITAERVHCLDPESSEVSSWSTTGQPGGVVLGATGDPVVASPEGLAVLDRSTGTLDLRVPIEQDRPENRANDTKVDSRGRVVGRHNGLRQAAGERGVVPRRRRPGDPYGRRPDDLQRARVR